MVVIIVFIIIGGGAGCIRDSLLAICYSLFASTLAHRRGKNEQGANRDILSPSCVHPSNAGEGYMN